MPAPDLSEHFREIDENDPLYVKPLDIPEGSEPDYSEPAETLGIESGAIAIGDADPTSEPYEPMPDELKELDDEDDWEEPEDRLDKADIHDEEDDD